MIIYIQPPDEVFKTSARVNDVANILSRKLN